MAAAAPSPVPAPAAPAAAVAKLAAPDRVGLKRDGTRAPLGVRREQSDGSKAVETLKDGAGELSSAKTPTARASALSVLFTGARGAASDVEPVVGAESSPRSYLAAAAAKEPAAERTPPPAAPAAPAHSKLRATLVAGAKWVLPIVAAAAIVYSLDFATKALAIKYLVTVFHECAWRAPFMLGIIPYITGLAFYVRGTLHAHRAVWRWSAKHLRDGRLGFYREELSGLDEMAAEHPSLKRSVLFFDIAIALMLGGLFGNGIDAIRLSGALDWIPVGRSLLNFADVALLTGLAFFQLASSFFVQIRAAHQKKEPFHFSTVGFLGLPLVGFFLAWTFGSAPSENVLNLALSHLGWVYVMGFSMLLGISRFLAALVVDRMAKRYSAESRAKPS